MSLISDAIRADLKGAYTAPDRHYHDLRHIEALLALARQHADSLSDPEALEAAIWFHDAIYDTRRHDNEDRSAELARMRLAGGAAPDRVERTSARSSHTSQTLVLTVQAPPGDRSSRQRDLCGHLRGPSLPRGDLRGVLALKTGTRLFHLASLTTYRRVAYAIVAVSALVSMPLLDRLLR